MRNALIFARSGERPKSKPAGRRTRTRTGPPQYIALAPEVDRLRDVEHVPFSDCAARMSICEAIVRRAYDYAHRDRVRAAVEGGQPYTRGRFVRIDHPVRCEIWERMTRGESAEFIAAAVGCSASTVQIIAREG